MSMADPPYFLDDDGNIQIDAEHNAENDASCMGACSTHPESDDRPCPACVFPPGEGDR